MKNEVVTEIVTFKMDSNLTDKEVIEIVNQLERDFHMTLDGYIDSELSKEKDAGWLLIMHWDSLDHLKAASKQMMIDSETEAFRKVVIPPSVKIAVYEKCRTWEIS